MATILMTWELGAGLGHLVPMRAIGDRLVDGGHLVLAAVRDLEHATRVFRGSRIRVVQAPFKQRVRTDLSNSIVTYAHILRNSGFGDPAELETLAAAWRHLIEMSRADLILFDHSPTALLASRAFDVKRVLIGVGFTYPPDTCPLPVLRPWLKPAPRLVMDDEVQVLEHANHVLKAWRVPLMVRLADLYQGAQDSLLTTIEALDPFAPRTKVCYLGPQYLPGSPPPIWPQTPGRRIFAYLKEFPALASLLKHLNDLELPTLIVAPEVRSSVKERFSSATLRFTTEPVDLRVAAAMCDMAILNGSNAAAATMLLAGKPALHIPIVLEQVYNTRAVEHLGAGLGAAPGNDAEIAASLKEVLANESFAENARRLAIANKQTLQPSDVAMDRITAILPKNE